MEQTHWWFSARRKILASIIRRWISSVRDNTILEVGTGTGAMGKMLSQYGIFVGLDLSVTALQYARSTLKNVALGQMGFLPFRDHFFDAVFALDLLEHVDNEVSALNELLRVCKLNGTLFLTVPAFQFLWGQHDVINRHRRRYTKTQLEAVLKRSHWLVKKVSYYNTMLFPLVAGVRLLNRFRPTLEGPRSDLHWKIPHIGNDLLDRIFSSERYLLERRDMPFGVSLVCVAVPLA